MQSVNKTLKLVIDTMWGFSLPFLHLPLLLLILSFLSKPYLPCLKQVEDDISNFHHQTKIFIPSSLEMSSRFASISPLLFLLFHLHLLPLITGNVNQDHLLSLAFPQTTLFPPVYDYLCPRLSLFSLCVLLSFFLSHCPLYYLGNKSTYL